MPDFLHTDANFNETQEGKFIAGVQELDAFHHGGVAVPVAVLLVESKMKMSSWPPAESRTHEIRTAGRR